MTRVEFAGYGQKEAEFMTEELRVKVGRAHEMVLGFDSLSPLEIRQRLAVPREVTSPGGEEWIQTVVSLGAMSEGFPGYIGELKSPDPDNSLPSVVPFELAIFLAVIREGEELKQLRYFFITDFRSWHQRIQGPTLRASFLRTIQVIREKAKTDYYDDAQMMEQIVILTDHIHDFCLANPPLSAHFSDRFWGGTEWSWLEYFDGQEIGYKGKRLKETHGAEAK